MNHSSMIKLYSSCGCWMVCVLLFVCLFSPLLMPSTLLIPAVCRMHMTHKTCEWLATSFPVARGLEHATGVQKDIGFVSSRDLDCFFSLRFFS